MNFLKNLFSSHKIVDCSHLSPVPERPALHLLYLLYYWAGTVASLWQHGDPIFTLTVLLSSPIPALLAYVPYRNVSRRFRELLQWLISGGALFWLIYRISSGTAPDKAILEFMALLALNFLMAFRPEDSSYLLLLSSILLLYGTLLPRSLLLYSIGIGSILLIAIFYRERTRALAEKSNPGEKTQKKLRRNWHLLLLHLALSISFGYIFFLLMPTEQTEGKGLFEVSFLHEKESLLPPDMQKWLESRRTLPGGVRIKENGGVPDTFSPSGRPLNIKNAKTTARDTQNSGGSSPPGDQLVFRVKSPLKLYHLARLYDNYDGTKWSVGKADASHRFRTWRNSPDDYYLFQDVKQSYTIYLWTSPQLFAAYRAIEISRDNYDMIPLVEIGRNGIRLRSQNYPSTPFRYQVISRIRTNVEVHPPPKDKDLSYYEETVPRKHYLALPKKKISRRLRKLVSRIVRDKKDPYARALALRDYLRQSYKYEQFSKPIPRGKEGTDYFLFQLKNGHCEYFASALAVMARLAGLPSRVATGYSPGNYDTLSNTFEVYEYHAHAWTQIFIEGAGWLTMDATPPGNIISQTTPLGIGQLRDPFGDEWRITPPERTRHTIETIKNAYMKSIENMDFLEEPDAASSALMHMALIKEKLEEKFRAIYNKKTAAGQRKNIVAPLSKNNGKKRLLQLRERLENELHHQCETLKNHWKKAASIPAGIIILWVLWLIFQKRIRRHRLFRRLDENIAVIHKQYRQNPRECMISAGHSAQLLLSLAGYPRKPREELPNYVRRLEKQTMEFLGLHEFFLAFYRAEYGMKGSPSDALRMLRTLRAARRRLPTSPGGKRFQPEKKQTQ